MPFWNARREEVEPGYDCRPGSEAVVIDGIRDEEKAAMSNRASEIKVSK